MCINEPPLSTVRVLADALCLHPIPNPESPQPETERTPSELTLFRRILLPHLARTNLNITEQDREEMRRRGLPPVTDADLAAARERYAREQEVLREREQEVLRERQQSVEPFRALPLRLDSDPVPQQAPILGPPSRDPGTNAFGTRTLEDALPSPRPEGPASGLENGNRAGATDEAGRRVVSDAEWYRWMQALMVNLLTTRSEDEERVGEGGPGG